MKSEYIAPCGIICNLCLSFQREKNKCSGCRINGPKPYHCTVCSIKGCTEKNGNPDEFCYKCNKFPCRKLKDFDKRYRIKYGESIIHNLLSLKELGSKSFISAMTKKWECPKCGSFFCMHNNVCFKCGEKNNHFPTN